MLINSWYDEECRDTRRCLQCEVTRGIYTHKQARATIQHLVWKKKRLYLAKFVKNVFRLFLVQESQRAWKMFNEKVLYDILGQPPFPHPPGTFPHESTLFTPQNVRNAMDWLNFGKAQD